MPIHTSWVSMIKAMSKQYKNGKMKCYDLSNGKKICAREQAWSVFYAKVHKEYGTGSESKPRNRGVQESEKDTEQLEMTELDRDMLIKWFLEEEAKKEQKEKGKK